PPPHRGRPPPRRHLARRIHLPRACREATASPAAPRRMGARVARLEHPSRPHHRSEHTRRAPAPIRARYARTWSSRCPSSRAPRQAGHLAPETRWRPPFPSPKRVPRSRAPAAPSVLSARSRISARAPLALRLLLLVLTPVKDRPQPRWPRVPAP